VMIQAEKVDRLEITGNQKCTIAHFEERGSEKKEFEFAWGIKCRKDSNQSILIPESKKPT
jgi:hypothetical protein